MKQYRKDTKLEITWHDIVSDATWQDDTAAEKAEPACCKTIGYYTMKRKDVLVIAHTITKGQRDSTVIPLGCIANAEKIWTDSEVQKLKDEIASLRLQLSKYVTG